MGYYSNKGLSNLADVSVSGAAQGDILYYNGSAWAPAAGWKVVSGNLLAKTDDTYDIGASGATRPRYVYVGTAILAPTFTATIRVVSPQLAASGDQTNYSGRTALTNVTAAKDSTGATLGETPTGINAENAAWMKVMIGTTVAYVPYWTA